MPEICGIPSAKNRGPKTSYFRRFSTTSHLNGYLIVVTCVSLGILDIY